MTGVAGPLLLLMGGHEDRSLHSPMHQLLVQLAGAGDARIVVCSAASDDQVEYGAIFVALLRALGAGNVEQVDIPDRAAAHTPSAIAAFAAATAVFFTGGDQRTAMARLAGTPVGAEVQRRAAEGLLIAGTSAGAALAGMHMISGASPDNVAPGLGVWPGVIVDQHFTQRGRLSRLRAAVAAHPGSTGVGVDEDTAVLVRNGRMTVIGSKEVTVITAASTGQPPTVRLLTPGTTVRAPGGTGATVRALG